MIDWQRVPSVSDAWTQAAARGALPTALDTRGLRSQFEAGVRARAVFTARGTSAIFASKIKEVVEAVASGEMGESEARVTLLDTLRALGYTPEGGFPDAPGAVPPAIAGTLQDLASFRRRDLIIRTQLDLMRGAGQQWRGHQPDRLAAAPAWELVRVSEADLPRLWLERWAAIGASPPAGGRMIALKGDPLWGKLGSSEKFDDALDTDHPPFAFTSGMGWREVPRQECDALGIAASDGTPIDAFFAAADPPATIRGVLPRPRLSMDGVDPQMLRSFAQDTSATISADGTAEWNAIMEQAAAEFAASRAAAAASGNP